eukprot:scaffold314440_cov36-Tisochrysis_lutea.AAC.1
MSGLRPQEAGSRQRSSLCFASMNPQLHWCYLRFLKWRACAARSQDHHMHGRSEWTQGVPNALRVGAVLGRHQAVPHMPERTRVLVSGPDQSRQRPPESGQAAASLNRQATPHARPRRTKDAVRAQGSSMPHGASTSARRCASQQAACS